MSENEFRKQAEQQIDKDAMEAADSLKVSEDVKENYEEFIERGAQAQGEGRIP